MSCGVPLFGSVLSPILWNSGYDWVLRSPLLRGIGVVSYDTLVTAMRMSHCAAAILATARVAQVVSSEWALWWPHPSPRSYVYMVGDLRGTMSG